MLLGKIPYQDVFDHKGFFLYCIQALALLINKGHWGFFLLSVINLSAVIYIWNAISGLLLTGWRRYVPTILALCLYVPLCNKGNDTEFWSLPYISYSLYLLARYYLTQKEISYWECGLMGIGAGLIAFMRLNNVAPICMACLALAVLYCQRKQYVSLFYSIVCVACGFLAAIGLTIMLFVILYGFEKLNLLFFGTFIYNLEYMKNFKETGISILQLPFYLSILVCLIDIVLSKKRIAVAFLIVSFIFAYCTFGKSFYNHYFTITLPLFVIGFVLLLDSNLVRRIAVNKCIVIGTIILVVSGCYFVWPDVYPRIQRGMISERGLRQIKDSLALIPPSEQDSIWNYNTGMNGANVLQTANRVQMNKIFLNFQLSVSNELGEIGTIEEIRPAWLMVNDKTIWKPDMKKDSIFITNNYTEAFRTDFETSFIKNVVFYKKK